MRMRPASSQTLTTPHSSKTLLDLITPLGDDFVPVISLQELKLRKDKGLYKSLFSRSKFIKERHLGIDSLNTLSSKRNRPERLR